MRSVFKRYELKFLISQSQKESLLSLMQNYMKPDPFGPSTISNLYFDTPDQLLIRRSNEKPAYKEKLRLRSYGVATPHSIVFPELKKKFDGVVYKRRVEMTEQEAMEYLCYGGRPKTETQITREIDYFCNFYAPLTPAVFLSYDREAFLIDEDFRMTFDENILFRPYDLQLTQGIYGTPLLSEGLVLLEVKTALGFPLWLTAFLSQHHIYKTSFSKYGKAHQLLSTISGDLTYVAS